jgi:hypothetical protein
MKTSQLRDKMLRMFPEEHRGNIQPILDSIVKSAERDGINRGRQEAAAMIEVLVLGDSELDIQKLRDTMVVLRDEANT